MLLTVARIMENMGHKKKKSGLLTNPIFYAVLGTILFACITVIGLRFLMYVIVDNYTATNTVDVPHIVLSPATRNTLPEITPVRQIYSDPDPKVDCGPGVNSGQYIKDKHSNCHNYVDCNMGNNVYSLMLKTECDSKQTQLNQNSNKTTQYPPCTLNYSDLGPITYYSIPPEECASKQIQTRVDAVILESKNNCIKNFGGENCNL